MRAEAMALAVSVALVGGCVLITGSTEGYRLVDSGSLASQSCVSASSCGDGGVCCLVVTSSTTSTAGTCLPSCSVTFPQLCSTNAECGAAGPCSMQTCAIDAGGGIPVSFQACGQVLGCTASP